MTVSPDSTRDSTRPRWGKDACGAEPTASGGSHEGVVGMAVFTLVCTLSPQRLILGGGVMQQDALLPAIRRNVRQLLNGYIDKSEIRDAIGGYIVPPQLGSRCGVLGAMLLAGQLRQRLKR